MPIMSSMPVKDQVHTVLLYGPPKTGKTEAAGDLSKLGYNIWYFDIEGGSLTLTKLPPEAQTRIHLFQVRDTIENQYAAKTLLKILNWRNVGPKQLCLAHGNLDCPVCKKDGAEFEEFDITKLGPRDIIVVDSLTQLSDSIIASVLPTYDSKAEFDHWANQGTKLDSLMDWMKASKCHVIFISHEQEIKMEDGKEKLTAVGGTRNYARKLARNFSHVVYMTIVNKTHRALSRSVAMNGVVTGSRTDADTEKTAPPGTPLLASIFPKLEPLSKP